MNQAALSIEEDNLEKLFLSENEHAPTFLQKAEPTTYYRPKNVPEELKLFLEHHADQWYTNEQLAEHLNHTASGIRNAVTKLKNTGLVKTRMTGPLAYRGWHTAPLNQPLPVPEMQKRIAARKCNRCETTYSRYWRSDLEEPNKWLCNNCGMNQRRGRLNQRSLPDLPKASKRDLDCDNEHDDDLYIESGHEEVDHDLIHIIPKSPAIKASAASDTRRRCANCNTFKSAGKWRRDRENYANYLCNKCGMNQRRSSLRKEPKSMTSSQSTISGSVEMDSGYRSARKSFRQKTAFPQCSRCNQPFPSLEVEPCKHRFCGECIPILVHDSIGKKSLECPECKSDSPDALPVLIATAILGGFLLDNFDQN